MNNNPLILVTGGTGYIGSHTVVELINKGYDVKVIDNLSNSNIGVLSGIEKITGKKPEFERIDMINSGALNNFFERHKNITAVIHFAALKAVGQSVQNPLLYYQNNLYALINLLSAMKIYGVENLVFSSSCTVYGQPDKLPVTENSPILPAESPYGNTKQIAEEIIYDSAKAFNLNGIALRYFNPIGAHHSALIGELPIGVPDNLVPYVTQTAIGIRDQLRIFGNDYDTPDGTCIRDYLHVTDLAKAHIVAVERLINEKNKKAFETFNLGTGNGTSVLDVVNSFEKVSGLKLNYRFAERRPGDIEKIWADTSFANSELKWKTELSLDDALLSAWNWEKHYRQTNK